MGSSSLRTTFTSRSVSASGSGNGLGEVLPRLEERSFDLCEWWRLRLCCDVALFRASPTDPFGVPTTVDLLFRRRWCRERERPRLLWVSVFAGCVVLDGMVFNDGVNLRKK